jgi:hypothetical protein
MSNSAFKVFLVVLAVVAVQAQYIQIDSYFGTGCSGTALLSSFYQSGTCVASASSSVKVEISGSAATYSTFSGNACAGTATSTVNIASSGTCATIGKVTFPVSGNFVQSYSYSDTGCSTLVAGPSSYPAGQCYNTIQFQTGHTLTICSGCTSSSAGSCTDSGVTSGQCLSASGSSGSVKYVFNAAARVPPVAGLIAVLAACVMAVAKLL